MIKYLGSKRILIPLLVEIVRRTQGTRSVLDLFSGSARVGHALKEAGYRVLANDHNAYAATLARCYVQADADDVLEQARRLIHELNRLPGRAGYFTETYCVRARYFQPRNGERIDAIRDAIARGGYEPELEAVLLTALLEAADRVDSTTGLQMAYLKSWSARSYQPLELRVPRILPRAPAGKGEAYELDALEAAGLLDADVAYLDPPYNQHSYLGNYHVWETLVRWDHPETYGIARKRLDVRTRHSPFNSRRSFQAALRAVLERLRAPVIIVSLNDEGFLTAEALVNELRALWRGAGRLSILERDFRRYVGARIGIYNPRGEKVGRVGRLRNKERLFILAREGYEPPLEDLAPTLPSTVLAGRLAVRGREGESREFDPPLARDPT